MHVLDTFKLRAMLRSIQVAKCGTLVNTCDIYICVKYIYKFAYVCHVYHIYIYHISHIYVYIYIYHIHIYIVYNVIYIYIYTTTIYPLLKALNAPHICTCVSLATSGFSWQFKEKLAAAPIGRRPSTTDSSIHSSIENPPCLEDVRCPSSDAKATPNSTRLGS